MVLLRELLDGILDSVSDKDVTWNIKSYKSREQCHTLVNTLMPCGKKILLELRILNQNGESEQLLLVRFIQMWWYYWNLAYVMGQASRDVTTDSTGSTESYGTPLNRNKTIPAYKSICTSHLDPESYHDERTKDTDEGICLADEDEGDDISTGQKDNEVKETGGKTVDKDANKSKDKNVIDEIEEESERGREHMSERRTNDHT